jgi:4-amino-4-deoxy-L-arabinose transferase-like glycosyltransferase
LTLAAAQIAAVAVGALPVYWLGRRHLGSETAALLVALAYLAYPWLAWSAIDAIHPVTFAIPLLLFALWFLDSDRLLPSRCARCSRSRPASCWGWRSAPSGSGTRSHGDDGVRGSS